MKSRFFTDTQGLDSSCPPRDKICVCLLMSHQAYEVAIRQANRLHMTSGEYIDQLLLAQRISGCDTKNLLPPDSPWLHSPPAPPGR